MVAFSSGPTAAHRFNGFNEKETSPLHHISTSLWISKKHFTNDKDEGLHQKSHGLDLSEFQISTHRHTKQSHIRPRSISHIHPHIHHTYPKRSPFVDMD